MATCNACGASIVWTRTRSGAHLPIDLMPAPGGNVILTVPHVDKDEPMPMSQIVRPDPEVTRWQSHYIACPDAIKVRKQAGIRIASGAR